MVTMILGHACGTIAMDILNVICKEAGRGDAAARCQECSYLYMLLPAIYWSGLVTSWLLRTTGRKKLQTTIKLDALQSQTLARRPAPPLVTCVQRISSADKTTEVHCICKHVHKTNKNSLTWQRPLMHPTRQNCFIASGRAV